MAYTHVNGDTTDHQDNGTPERHGPGQVPVIEGEQWDEKAQHYHGNRNHNFSERAHTEMRTSHLFHRMPSEMTNRNWWYYMDGNYSPLSIHSPCSQQD